MKRIQSLVALALLLGGLLGSGWSKEVLRDMAKASPGVVFSQGVEAYREQDFGFALENFRTLSGLYRSPEVEYNLGNAAYQAGDVGSAVLAWKRSLRLDPFRSDVEHNLRAALGQEPYGEGLRGKAVEIYMGLPRSKVRVLLWIGVALSLFGLALWRLGGLWQGRIGLALGLALVLGFGVWDLARARRWVLGAEAVAVGRQEIIARAGPGEAGVFPEVFRISPGTVLEVRRRSQEHVQVILPGTGAGWVDARSVQEVEPKP